MTKVTVSSHVALLGCEHFIRAMDRREDREEGRGERFDEAQ